MRRKNNIAVMTTIALLVGVMFLFGFTPIGTIPFFGLTITLMGIPVAIIACLFGPLMGAFAGLVWGTISLIQAFMGTDPLVTQILASDTSIISNGVKYGGLITMCYSRVLVGFLTGVIYDAIHILDKKGIFASVIASMFTSILNTILFMSMFCLFFYQTPVVQTFAAEQNIATNNFVLFIIALVGVNFFAEFGTNAIIGGSAVFGLSTAAKHLQITTLFPHFWDNKKELVSDATPENA